VVECLKVAIVAALTQLSATSQVSQDAFEICVPPPHWAAWQSTHDHTRKYQSGIANGSEEPITVLAVTIILPTHSLGKPALSTSNSRSCATHGVRSTVTPVVSLTHPTSERVSEVLVAGVEGDRKHGSSARDSSQIR
jgi:hypothetical protein